jgi:hypothetical protein
MSGLAKFYGCPPRGSCYTSRVAAIDEAFVLFDPTALSHASVAQSVEQLTLNQLVLGSNPSRGTSSATLPDRSVILTAQIRAAVMGNLPALGVSEFMNSRWSLTWRELLVSTRVQD